MGLVAYLDDADTSEQRRAPRRTLRLEVGVVSEASAAARMTIHDLSPAGLLVETSDGPPVGEKLQIELPGTGSFPAKVMWSSGRFVGCKFDRPLPQAAISAALLKGVTPGEQDVAGPAGMRPVEELQARVRRLVEEPDHTRELAARLDPQLVAQDDRLPLHTRGRILLGLGAGSAAIWGLAFWAVGIL